MNGIVDMCAIAKHCRDEREQQCLKSGYMRCYSIIYMAIYHDESVSVSANHLILKNAERCFLIHSWEEVPVSNGYMHYYIQSISSKGEVGGENIDEEYSLHLFPAWSDECPKLALYRLTYNIYQVPLGGQGLSYNAVLQRELINVWNLYKKSKEKCKTIYESQLIGYLAHKEKSIKALESKLESMSVKEAHLEREISQYRTLLDEIKNLFETK